VTAVFNLLPGFFLLYAATPALVIPAPELVERKFFLLRFGMLLFARAIFYPYDKNTVNSLLDPVIAET